MYRNNFNLGDENMDITLIFKVAGVGILISFEYDTNKSR